MTVAPMSRVPGIPIQTPKRQWSCWEGELQALVGSQRIDIEPGDVVLAPAGTVHGFINLSDTPARLLYVFPIHDPDRVFSTPPDAMPQASRPNRDFRGSLHRTTVPSRTSPEYLTAGMLFGTVRRVAKLYKAEGE